MPAFKKVFSIHRVSIYMMGHLYGLGDLHKASSSHRSAHGLEFLDWNSPSSRTLPEFFLRLDSTKALIGELSKGKPLSEIVERIDRPGTPYACPEIALAYTAWVEPDLHSRFTKALIKRGDLPPGSSANPADGQMPLFPAGS